MTDRRDVHPHHLLRAVLTDRDVREILLELGAEPDEVLLTLDREWLGAADTIEPEEVAMLGIDLATVLTALNPPYDAPPDWRGRQVTDATRELLVRSLAARGATHGGAVEGGHVLLALLSSRDHIVAATFRAHGLSPRTARGAVERRYRRA